MKHRWFWMCITILFLVACSNEEANIESEEPQMNPREEQTSPPKRDEVSTNEEDREEETEEKITREPVDQGDREVWFEGEVVVDKKEVQIKGTTNLLPESLIHLSVESQDGVIIGAIDQVEVEENGTFHLETKLPTMNEDNLLFVSISFSPSSQSNGDIQAHYENQLEGDFIRMVDDGGIIIQKATFQTVIPFNWKTQLTTIEAPNWEDALDLGDPEVRMEVSVEELASYIHVNVDSNIIEGAFVRGNIHVPDYLMFGLSDATYVNPDGSIDLYIQNPADMEQLKGINMYTIEIEVDMFDGNNGEYVLETYGEFGEKLTGTFVKEEEFSGESYFTIFGSFDINIE